MQEDVSSIAEASGKLDDLKTPAKVVESKINEGKVRIAFNKRVLGNEGVGKWLYDRKDRKTMDTKDFESKLRQVPISQLEKLTIYQEDP